MSDDTRIDEGPPPEKPKTSWWQARSGLEKFLLIVGGALAALVVIGAIAGGGDDDDPEAGANSTPTTGNDVSTTAGVTTTAGEATTTMAEATTTAGPTTTTAPTTTAAPTTTTPPEPVVAEGSGDSVIDFAVRGNIPSVLALAHDGSSNFAVTSYNSVGDSIDLLVNTVGAYSGNVPINFFEGEDVAELEITADGTWTATATSVFAAPSFDDSYEGAGDDVVQFAGTGTRLAITHYGESNFVIEAYGETSELLVNEIGPYTGTVRIPDGTLVISVTADGAWTFDVE